MSKVDIMKSSLTQIAQGNNAVNLGYDASGRRTSLTYPNGANTSYFYDDASRVTQILHDGPSSVIENLFYTYDAAGNRISFDRLGPQAALPQPIQAAHNTANQLTQFNTETLTYDANGNLTFDGTTTYIWDARNRLIQMGNTDLLAQFTYDALGRRVSKTINGVMTEYLYDRDNIVAEIQNGAVAATYLRSLSLDEPFLRSSEVAEYYHVDALRSVLSLSDDTGTVQTTYSYDPFGNTTVSGTSSNPFQYTGRENDQTAFYYYRARYYTPKNGRFLSEDPLYSPLLRSSKCRGSYSQDVGRYMELDKVAAPLIGLREFDLTSMFSANPEQLHLYAYTNNNPINMVDPSGLISGPQIEGCDVVGDLGGFFTSPCAKRCCFRHDRCFENAFSTCDASSWVDPFAPLDCKACNATVTVCMLSAIPKGRKDCKGGGASF